MMLCELLIRTEGDETSKSDVRSVENRMHSCDSDGLIYFSFLIPQGIASDIVRHFAFFSYFTIQLAQLFLCCFADQPPEGKTVLEKVSRTVS